MPNWIINKITFTGKKENIAKLFSLIENKEANMVIDFEKLIPYPASKEECPIQYLKNQNSHIEEDKKRPWLDWYEWHCDNWGTKWNACESSIVDNTLYFQTAWACPEPVIEKLAELATSLNIKMEGMFADEDIGGGNCGYITNKGARLAEDGEVNIIDKELWGRCYRRR